MRVKVRPDFRQLAQDGRTHPGLSVGAEFFVIGVDSECYRVVNNLGEPILYPKQFFRVLNDGVPSGWRFGEYEDGEYFLEPMSTSAAGFYEKWHGSDGDHAAQAAARVAFREELIRLAAEASVEDRQLIDGALARLPRGTDSAPHPLR